MSFFKKLFGRKGEEQPEQKPEEQPEEQPVAGDSLPWIKAEQNPWNIDLLDLRPVTQAMVSSSKDPRMATNAVSYSGEDGKVFWNIKPEGAKTIDAHISFVTDKKLYPGVLFIPDTMEHKWAIYFDGSNVIFVRSWLREVQVVAETVQQQNKLTITSISGSFIPNEPPEFTRAAVTFLLISYVLGEVSPAPLPDYMEADTREAALAAFSLYGNKAQIGTFNLSFEAWSDTLMRSHSLLHIAVAREDTAEVAQLLESGFDINSLAGDGRTPLHWAVSAAGTASLTQLLSMGVSPDTRAADGATALMMATESKKADKAEMLLQAGANVNAQDNRGFTALHRASEMGHLDLARLLLASGADKSLPAGEYTALSLAQMREQHDIIKLLN
ncbi:ankyrin repeat domain-containing protein [Chitinophagaceae bacterium MMS25-I14]